MNGIAILQPFMVHTWQEYVPPGMVHARSAPSGCSSQCVEELHSIYLAVFKPRWGVQLWNFDRIIQFCSLLYMVGGVFFFQLMLNLMTQLTQNLW